MSTSPIYFVRDNNSLKADSRVIPGDDLDTGLTDNNAFRTYGKALSMAATAAAGTIFKFCDGGGFRQTANFMYRNTNTFTKINSISRVGNVATALTSKNSNMTVGQMTVIRNLDQREYNGMQQVTGVVDNGVNSSFTFNVVGNPATPATHKRVIRFDGAMIKFERYRSSLFDIPGGGFPPWCDYTDSSDRQYRFDGNTDLEGFSLRGINHDYIGQKSGVPDCLFLYKGNKNSVHAYDCIFQNYRIAVSINPKAANSWARDIQIHRCLIRGNWSQGILAAPSESNFENNTFTDNGHNITGGNNRLHNLYIGASRSTYDPNYAAYDLVITDNDFSKSAMNNGKATGNEVIFHGQVKGVLFEHNYIHNLPGVTSNGNYGLAVTSAYLTPEKLENFTIRDNRIENCGLKAIACSSLLNSTVEMNTIICDAPNGAIGIDYVQERATAGTVASDNNRILNNYITGAGLNIDIRTTYGTNFTVVKTNVPVPQHHGNTDTVAPIVTPPLNVLTEASGVLTTVILGTATATDNVDRAVAVTNDAPVAFGLGVTVVTYSATDAAGNTSTATQLVTVQDTTMPVVIAPVDITVQATDANNIVIDIGQATASDTVDGAPAIANDAPVDYAPGSTTQVTWTATDSSGNVGAAVQNITVVAVQMCVVQVKTTTEISVDGLVTATNQCITNG